MNAPLTTCPKCHSGLDVTGVADASTQEWAYSCDNHAAPHEWRQPIPVKSPAKPKPPTAAETMKALGVPGELLACIHDDDPWLEYGIVEDRLRRRSPQTYAELVDTYGHSARNAVRGGPDEDAVRARTTSNRLSQELGRLAEAGLISQWEGPGTGYWSYLTKVSYWGPTPPPANGSALTWTAYAQKRGMDPQSWVLPAAETDG